MTKIGTQRGRRLGILIAGLNGAISTTFLAGVMAIRCGLAQPIGSLTQLATLSPSNQQQVTVREYLPVTSLNDLVFGGWDITDQNCYESAMLAGVLRKEDLDRVRSELEEIHPMKGVFDRAYVKNLNGSWTKTYSNKYLAVEKLRHDIREFKNRNQLDDVVTIWCGSTEIYMPLSPIHCDFEVFEQSVKNNNDHISPCMMYAFAAISENSPFVNASPNLCADMPALVEYSHSKRVPISGKDLKTGQTLLKTAIAPMLKARMLGLNGWFSTNILGNSDGYVLNDPGSFKTKQESKLSVLDGILDAEQYPMLYRDYCHQVCINYYPPSGDNKESWDNIDIFGWLNYPMQIKIDFLCRDSILAAPIVLDLVLFMDLAQRSGFCGVQQWLSFYFKSPMQSRDSVVEHDLFVQLEMLKRALHEMKHSDMSSFYQTAGLKQ